MEDEDAGAAEPRAMTVDNGDPHNVSASDPAAAPGQDQPVESEVSTAAVPEPPASPANKRPRPRPPPRKASEGVALAAHKVADAVATVAEPASEQAPGSKRQRPAHCRTLAAVGAEGRGWGKGRARAG